MKTFVQWWETVNKQDLAFLEDIKRTGIHTAYPDAYVRAQYPDAYFPPHSATAYLDLKNHDSKVKSKAPAKMAP